jgi:hypothetical protein
MPSPWIFRSPPSRIIQFKCNHKSEIEMERKDGEGDTKQLEYLRKTPVPGIVERIWV